MFNIVLYQPEIPPNTGNIIRLAANTGCKLHLIEPLGFRLEEKQLRRAGLDYREFAKLQVYSSFEQFLEAHGQPAFYALSTKAEDNFTEATFTGGEYFLFGPETRGLPQEIIEQASANQHCLRLPMMPESRSLNLSNTVAVVVYEAWRQCGFGGSV